MSFRFRNALRGSEVLLALLFIAAATALSVGFGSAQRQAAESRETTRVDALATRIHNDMVSRSFALAQVGRYFQSTAPVSYDEWARFVEPILDHFPELTGIAYVAVGEGPALERAVTLGQTQDPNFSIFELTAKGPRAVTRQAGPRAPVVYVSTDDRNTEALGLDLYREPARAELLKQVSALRRFTLSEPLVLVDTAAPVAVLFGVPIVDGASISRFIVGAVQIDTLVTQILTGTGLNDSAIRIIDAERPDQTLYNGLAAADPANGVERHRTIQIGGRTWDISFNIAPVRIPLWVFLLWLVPSLLALTMLVISTQRRVQLAQTQAEVTRTVADSERLNQDLIKERAKLTESLDHINRKNRELESFAYVASHDLKAPLRGIRNVSAWLLEDLALLDLPASITEYNLRLTTLTQKMGDLLDGLLGFNRARLDDQQEPVDLNAMVAEIAADVDQSHGPFGLTCTELPTLQTRESALRRVLTELITNAVVHNSNAAPALQLTATPDANGLVFRLCDNGTAIPVQARDRVFEIFQTLHATGDRVAGLGLAVVRKLVSYHGGHIHIVDNTKTDGTCFEFSWPCTLAADSSEA
ncbi:sensor histidine kinase [Litorivicinus lipolyticus]|uniref:sensor histidine kinase n=1 Tax=Litorivicinus lipolyticus TaxID=418701 RepID=UPI003B59E07E